MTTVDFNAMRRKDTDYGPLAELVSSLRDGIIADVRAEMTTTMVNAIAAAFREHGVPNVTVSPAPVNTLPVPPAEVTVNPTVRAPDVHIHSDEGEEVEAIDRQTQILSRIYDKLTEIAVVLGQPVVKDVERDSNQNITRVTEHR